MHVTAALRRRCPPAEVSALGQEEQALQAGDERQEVLCQADAGAGEAQHLPAQGPLLRDRAAAQAGLPSQLARVLLTC